MFKRVAGDDESVPQQLSKLWGASWFFCVLAVVTYGTFLVWRWGGWLLLWLLAVGLALFTLEIVFDAGIGVISLVWSPHRKRQKAGDHLQWAVLAAKLAVFAALGGGWWTLHRIFVLGGGG